MGVGVLLSAVFVACTVGWVRAERLSAGDVAVVIKTGAAVAAKRLPAQLLTFAAPHRIPNLIIVSDVSPPTDFRVEFRSEFGIAGGWICR